MTACCVLRSGGDYCPRWVRALKAGVRRHLPGATFVCLSDVPVPGVIVKPLLHDWPGWWSKIEIFRPQLFRGRVMYVDLDTLPVGDLSDLASYDGTFAALSDFNRPNAAQSGVLLWRAGFGAELYEMFRKDSIRIRREFRGDGEWIHAMVSGEERVQDLFPGQVVSLKHGVGHPRKGQVIEAPPRGARLVCGHGRPRLSHPSAGWAHRLWSAAA